MVRRSGADVRHTFEPFPLVPAVLVVLNLGFALRELCHVARARARVREQIIIISVSNTRITIIIKPVPPYRDTRCPNGKGTDLPPAKHAHTRKQSKKTQCND